MPRPRQFDPETALNQAVSTFWKSGYDKTSVQDLCDVMGIRPASLYGAFGDKRRLFVQALETYMRRSQANAAQAVGDARGLEGVERFFARLVDRLSSEQGAWGCLVTNSAAEIARRDPEIARMIELHWARLSALMARLLSEARTDEQLRPGAGPEASAMLICIAQGLNVMAKVRPAREQLDSVVGVALDGIRCNPERKAPTLQ